MTGPRRLWPAPCQERGLEHDWYDDMKRGRITKSGEVLEVFRCSRCGSFTERKRP